MKKFLALLLAVTMLMGIMPVMNVFAADFAPVTSDETKDVWATGEWVVSDWSSTTNAVKKSFNISPSVTYQGTGALHMVYEDDGDSATNDRFAVRQQNKLTAGNEYKVSLYAKVNFVEQQDAAELPSAFFYAHNKGNIAFTDETYFVGEATADGWQKIEVEFTAGGTAGGAASFDIYAQCGRVDLYLDNISIYDKTANVEICATELDRNFDNNSFEYATAEGETVSANSLGWMVPDWSSVSLARKKHHHVSTKESYEGSGSLHVQYWTDGIAGNDRFAIRSDNHYLDGSSNYKLTMYIKTIGNSLTTVDTNGTTYTMQVLPGGNAGTINVSDSVLTATEKEGWKKLEKTFKSTATTDRLQIYFGQGNADVYIDSISICKDNGDGTYGENIFADKGEMMYNFDEDTEAAVFAPITNDEDTTIDAWDFGWVWSNWNTTTNAKKMSYSISPSVTHKGSGALHMVYDDDDDVSTDDRYAIRQQNKLTVGNTYKLSLYAKVNFVEQQDVGTNSSAFIFAGKKGNISFTDANYYVGEADDEGWQKIEIEFDASSTNLDIYAERGRVDLYIDTVSLIDVTNNNTEILDTVKKRSFDEDGETSSGGGDEGGDGSDVPSEPWTDEDVEEIIPSNVTDFTGVGASDYGWEVSNFEGANGTIQVSSATAYEGKNSLHIKYSKTGTKDYALIRPKSNDNNNLVAGTKYKVTMYIRPVVNTADGIGAKFISHSTAASFGNTKGKITKADKPGWYKYEDEGVVELTRLHLMANGGICEFYVDNVSVSIVDENGVAGENRFADKRGTFEAEGATGYTVSGPKLYDEDGNEVTDVTAAVSGKKITAAAAVANYTEADTFTGEIIVCLYKGDVLQDTVMSGAQNIKTTDSAKFLTTDITMPEITEETAGDYTIRVFVWESLAGMAPLSLSTAF